jgi:hypothetical protein
VVGSCEHRDEPLSSVNGGEFFYSSISWLRYFLQVDISLCLIKYHALRTKVGVNIYFHILALDGGE